MCGYAVLAKLRRMTTDRIPVWALAALVLFAVAMGVMGALNSIHTIAQVVWALLAVAGVYAAVTAARRAR
jgi:hypothetical protein